MARPATPFYVDRTPLGALARDSLENLIDVIYTANPTRAPAATLSHAIESFKMMFQRGPQGWERKPYFRIGKDGNGPVVVSSHYPNVVE